MKYLTNEILWPPIYGKNVIINYANYNMQSSLQPPISAKMTILDIQDDVCTFKIELIIVKYSEKWNFHDFKVMIPIPNGTKLISLNSSAGHANYNMKSQRFVWTIQDVDADHQYELNCKVNMPVERIVNKPVHLMQVYAKIENCHVSGIHPVDVISSINSSKLTNSQGLSPEFKFYCILRNYRIML